MHGDINYKPTFAERNGHAELRYIEVSLGAALTKTMWDGRAVDPFQCMTPFWMHEHSRTGQRMAMTSAYRRGAAFVSWFIRSDYMQSREFGNSSDMWIDDSDRAQRCYDAAENGCDGSTHAERIQDWRDGFRNWLRDRERGSCKDHTRFDDAVTLYLDELESWHEMNGTLWQQIN